MRGKILKQISTHKAVENVLDGTIEIWIKGFKIYELEFKDEYLYSIPKFKEDDLFDIFEKLQEENRINVAEMNAAMSLSMN